MKSISSLFVSISLAITSVASAASNMLGTSGIILPAPQVYAQSRFVCPASLEMMPTNSDMPSYWVDDGTYSVVDPVKQAAYNVARKPFDAARWRVNRLVDLYVTGAGYNGNGAPTPGDAKVGACLFDLLSRWTDANALLGQMSPQAIDYAGFMVPPIAIGLLTAKSSAATIDETKLRKIEDWVRRTSDIPIQKMAYAVSQGRANNLYYWAGYSALLTGMATDDMPRFDYGRNAIHKGLSDISLDGFLPRELLRGAHALDYHSFALQPLAMGSLILRNSGDKLSQTELTSLDALTKRVTDGATNPVAFVTDARQSTGATLPTQKIMQSKEQFYAAMEPLSLIFPANAKVSQNRKAYAPFAINSLGPSLTYLFKLTPRIGGSRR